MVTWTEMEKSAFVEMQFRAQDQYYREALPKHELRRIVSDRQFCRASLRLALA